MRHVRPAAVVGALVVAGAMAVGPAQASSTHLRAVPVVVANEHGVPGSTAVANEPQLADAILWSLLVSVPLGYDWSATELRIELTSGRVFNAAPTAGGTDANPPGPLLWGREPRFSPGAYDTFVHSKGLAPAALVGKLNADHSQGPLPAEGLSTNNAQVISASWGNVTDGEDGFFQIAQFTLSADATGTIFGRTHSTDQVGFHVFQGYLFFPEPTGFAVVLLAGVGLLRRRTTRWCTGRRVRRSRPANLVTPTALAVTQAGG